LATWWGIWSSRRQLSYLAQALNFQLVTARSPAVAFLTKMGPESRSQTRSVGQWWKWQAGEVGAAALEHGGGAALGGLVVDQDVDVFDAGEMADDLGVDPGDGLEFAGPVLGVVRPGDPGGGVGLPLGGHADGSVAAGNAATAGIAGLRLGEFALHRGGGRRRDVALRLDRCCQKDILLPYDRCGCDFLSGCERRCRRLRLQDVGLGSHWCRRDCAGAGRIDSASIFRGLNICGVRGSLLSHP
jgi:hypothetical protein